MENWWSQISRKYTNLTKYPPYIFIIDYIHNLCDRYDKKRSDGQVNIIVKYIESDEKITELCFSDNIMYWKIEYLKIALLNRNLDRKTISEFINHRRAGLYKEAFVDLIIKFSKEWIFMFYDIEKESITKVKLIWDEDSKISSISDEFHECVPNESDLEKWNKFKYNQKRGIIFWTEKLRNDKEFVLEDIRNSALIISEGEKNIDKFNLAISCISDTNKQDVWNVKYFDMFCKEINTSWYFYDNYYLKLFKNTSSKETEFYLDVLKTNLPIIIYKNTDKSVSIDLNDLKYLGKLYIRFSREVNNIYIKSMIIENDFKECDGWIINPKKSRIKNIEKFDDFIKNYRFVTGIYKISVTKLRNNIRKLCNKRPTRNILKIDKFYKNDKISSSSGLYDFRNGSWIGLTNQLESNNICINNVTSVSSYKIGFYNDIDTPTINLPQKPQELNLVKKNLRQDIDKIFGYSSIKADAPDSESRKELNNVISGIFKYINNDKKDNGNDYDKICIQNKQEKLLKNFNKTVKSITDEFNNCEDINELENASNHIENLFQWKGDIYKIHEPMKKKIATLKNTFIEWNNNDKNYKFKLAELSCNDLIKNENNYKIYLKLKEEIDELDLDEIKREWEEIIYNKLSDKYVDKLEKIENVVDDKVYKKILEDIQLNTDKLSSLET